MDILLEIRTIPIYDETMESSLWNSLVAYIKGENSRYKKRIDQIDEGVTERRQDVSSKGDKILENRLLQLEQGKAELVKLIEEMARDGLKYLPSYRLAKMRLEQYNRATAQE